MQASISKLRYMIQYILLYKHGWHDNFLLFVFFSIYAVVQYQCMHTVYTLGLCLFLPHYACIIVCKREREGRDVTAASSTNYGMHSSTGTYHTTHIKASSSFHSQVMARERDPHFAQQKRNYLFLPSSSDLGREKWEKFEGESNCHLLLSLSLSRQHLILRDEKEKEASSGSGVSQGKGKSRISRYKPGETTFGRSYCTTVYQDHVIVRLRTAHIANYLRMAMSGNRGR